MRSIDVAVAAILFSACTASTPGTGPLGGTDFGALGHFDLGKNGIISGPPDGASVSNHSGNTIDGGTCAGGCFMGTTCTMLNNATACGTGGAACQVCGSGTSCVNGSCRAPCSATTCGSGCCDSTGKCILSGGQDTTHCGTQGQTCGSCADGQTCTQGACLDGPPSDCTAGCPNGCCDSSGNCQSGSNDTNCGSDGDSCFQCTGSFHCQQQECFVDPESTWDLYVDQAQVALVDNNGDYWDAFNGLPDPFVVVMTGTGADAMSAQTAYQSDTTSPAWGVDMGGQLLLNGLRAAVYQQKGVTFTFYDQDDLTRNDFMGSCTFLISDYDFSAPSLERVCGVDKATMNSGFVIDFHLVPHF